jgi:glycosyltransferase involved in cell wall biosynthesis
VPIVYDSSSAAGELVIDGENGILVENNNRKLFADKLKYLILNEEIRKEMSIQSIESSNRFSVEKVANLWNDLLQSL